MVAGQDLGGGGGNHGGGGGGNDGGGGGNGGGGGKDGGDVRCNDGGSDGVGGDDGGSDGADNVVVVLYRAEGRQAEPIGRVGVGGVVGHSHLGVLSLNTILSIR